MIYITQIIYLKEGQEITFHLFENVVIPAMNKYNGRLLFRVRPDYGAFIESNIERPYEIHLIEFASQKDFDDFRNDEERQEYLHMKQESIRSVMLIQGTLIG